MAISGPLESYYKDHAAPGSDPPETDADEGNDAEDEEESTASADRPTHVIERPPTDTRLVVLGSSSFVEDAALSLARRAGSEQFVSNLMLAQNLVDWAGADEDLLSIRAAGSYSRTLEIPPSDRERWEWANYAIVAFRPGPGRTHRSHSRGGRR